MKQWATVSELRELFPDHVGYGTNLFQFVRRAKVRRRMGTVRTKTHLSHVWRYNTTDVQQLIKEGKALG